jgi:hypothetical protein
MPQQPRSILRGWSRAAWVMFGILRYFLGYLDRRVMRGSSGVPAVPPGPTGPGRRRCGDPLRPGRRLGSGLFCRVPLASLLTSLDQS